MLKFSFVTIFSLSVISGEVHNCFPESNILLPVRKARSEKSFFTNKKEFGLSEIEFHQVIDRFQSVWGPVVKEKYQKNLIVTRDWENARVNAHATRDDLNNPVIVVRGGLARHPEMTSDALMLMLCHELGHHYGGAPKLFRGNTSIRSWSSAEGQADYFATSKCMPKILEQDSFKSYTLLPEIVRGEVEKVCQSEECSRITMAAVSMGKIFASLRSDWSEPKILEKDNQRVEVTNYGHPNPQCRFDTLIAGLNCEQALYSDFDNVDYSVGACFEDQKAMRPRCWFSPKSY